MQTGMIPVRLEMRATTELSHRQRLEAQLQAALRLEHSQRLELKLYEQWGEVVAELYMKAMAADRICRYKRHGFDFEYALLSLSDITRELHQIEAAGFAFCFCLNETITAKVKRRTVTLPRGMWLLCVVHDGVPGWPKRFYEYAAVHERGEQVTMGQHALASKLEFAIAAREGKLGAYMEWLEENHPRKFSDVLNHTDHLRLPDDPEFLDVVEESVSTEEARRVARMIEEFDWPLATLRRLNLCKKRQEQAQDIMYDTLRVAELVCGQRGLPLPDLVKKVRQEVRLGLRKILDSDLSRDIHAPHFDQLWREGRIRVDRIFDETRNARIPHPDYLAELAAAEIGGSLPNDGVLSHSFKDALRALQIWIARGSRR